jgi:hypothetical protein
MYFETTMRKSPARTTRRVFGGSNNYRSRPPPFFIEPDLTHYVSSNCVEVVWNDVASRTPSANNSASVVHELQVMSQISKDRTPVATAVFYPLADSYRRNKPSMHYIDGISERDKQHIESLAIAKYLEYIQNT